MTRTLVYIAGDMEQKSQAPACAPSAGTCTLADSTFFCCSGHVCEWLRKHCEYWFGDYKYISVGRRNRKYRVHKQWRSTEDVQINKKLCFRVCISHALLLIAFPKFKFIQAYNTSQRVNSFNTVVRTVSVTGTQLCLCSMKAHQRQ